MYNLNLINNSTYSKYITEVINRLHVKLEESCAVFTHYDSLYSYITSSILNRNLHHDDCKSLIIETLSAYKQNHEVTWSDIYTVSEYTWYIKSYMNDLEDELNTKKCSCCEESYQLEGMETEDTCISCFEAEARA